MNDPSKRPPLSHVSGTPVADNSNIQTAGPHGLNSKRYSTIRLARSARPIARKMIAAA
jgi:hypothetical protein